MALADLLDALTRDADTRAQALVDTAREAAERGTAAARSAWDRRLAAALAVREAELRAEAQTEIEKVRREAARDALRARAEALGRILAETRAVLARRVGEPGLEAIWAQDVADALTYLPGDGAVVRRPPETAGVRVVAADGSVEVDGTIEARLARLEPELAIELAGEIEADT